MTEKTQPTDAGAQPATDRETHFYLAGWNGARKEVEANAHFRQALQAAPLSPAAVGVPAEVELPDVEDMAHSAVQEALSFGVNHDVFHRWMRAVMDKTVQAMAAAPAQEHATQLAGQGAEVIENLLRLAQIVDRAVEDWGESFPDGSCDVKFHKDEAVKMEAILEFFDSLPDAPEDEGVIESGPLKAARAIRAATPAQAQEDAQIAKLTTAYTELSNMFHDQIVAQQAAWIEWQHGQGAEAAMGWIENGLCGPGHIPDEDDPYGKQAQAWFDANKSDPFPACACGRPSNIFWMDQGFCSKAHYDAARTAQGGA